MSALDDLSNFKRPDSSQLNVVENEVKANIEYDLKTPDGYFLNVLEREGFNLDEIRDILRRNGNQLVDSCAGSGKTTLLIFKVMMDIITGYSKKIITPENCQPARVLDRILVTTFSESGANELREKTLYWQNKFRYAPTATSVTFCTIDALFKRTLTEIGVQTKIIDDKVNMGILANEVNKLGISRLDGYPLTSDDFSQIASLVTYARNTLTPTERYNHKAVADYDITPTYLEALISNCKQARKKIGVMDFIDINETLYSALKVNPALRDFIAEKYVHIYIDECQDTSELQYETIKYFTQNSKTVFWIGDDDQIIYTWRGSAVSIITKRIEEDFKPYVSVLSTNYRCPSNILKPLARSIVNNKERHIKPLKSSREGGSVKVFTSTSSTQMINNLIRNLEHDVENNIRSTVVVRTNYDGVIPAFILEMTHLCDFSIKSDKMTLKSALPQKILALSTILTDRGSQKLSQALSLLVSKTSRYQISQLVQACKNTNCSLMDIPLKDIQYSLPELMDIIQALRKILAETGEIEALRYLYKYTLFQFTGNSPYALSASGLIQAFLFLLDTESFDTALDFRTRVVDINTGLTQRIRKKNTRYAVATVHEVKGKERPSIHVWNAIEGVFPDSKSTTPKAFEEERRLFYIAGTRAKESLSIYTIDNLESTFLLETGLKPCNKATMTGKIEKPLNKVEQEEERINGIISGLTQEEVTSQDMKIFSK